MYPKLSQYIESVIQQFDKIPPSRKEELELVSDRIKESLIRGNHVSLVFICTHNSRRSHMGQLWASTAAHYYGLSDQIDAYSGGTEVTAFNPRAVAAMERAGFKVEDPGGDNPEYRVFYADESDPMVCFSKKYNDVANPQKNFIAIMTCSDADENCPFIPGAVMRAPLTYSDPKSADDTPHETLKYDERSKQIATEIFYLMSRSKSDS